MKKGKTIIGVKANQSRDVRHKLVNRQNPFVDKWLRLTDPPILSTYRASTEGRLPDPKLLRSSNLEREYLKWIWIKQQLKIYLCFGQTFSRTYPQKKSRIWEWELGDREREKAIFWGSNILTPTDRFHFFSRSLIGPRNPISTRLQNVIGWKHQMNFPVESVFLLSIAVTSESFFDLHRKAKYECKCERTGFWVSWRIITIPG